MALKSLLNNIIKWLEPAPKVLAAKKNPKEAYLITKKEVLMGRDVKYPQDYTDYVSSNIDYLLKALNKFRAAYGKLMYVSSGWRPETVNKSIGGATKSAHTVGWACDFRDPDGELAKFALEMDRQGKLKEWGLWLEDPSFCNGWIHLDVRNRGNRKSHVFKP